MDTTKPRLSLFMAVPTIYSRLLDVYATFDESKQTLAREACEKFRLMVSGSGTSASAQRCEPTAVYNPKTDLFERYSFFSQHLCLPL